MDAEIAKESLSHSVVKGGLWVFAIRLTERVFYLVRLIILARILAPHDFGLLGIAMLTMSTLDSFSQTGFRTALIQKKEEIKTYLDSAWTVGIVRGIILFAILFFLAPYAAVFFNTPQAKLIIQVVGFSFLLHAFTNIGVVHFQKELEFSKLFIYRLSGILVDFIVAVSAAFILKSVWALVFGLLAGNIVRLFLSYIIHPHKPHISFDIDKLKELFGFGKWVLVSSVLVFLITQGDDAFVGKFLSVTMLGFYQMAYRIANIPATEITHVISQVTFPAYSKLQDNIPNLREAYLKTLQVTTFLSIPITGLIFVLAPDFTMIFLGEKWMPIVPAMQVLVIAGLIRSIAATTSTVLYAVGKPGIDTKLQIISLFVLSSLIYPLTVKWGIFGSSLAVFFSFFVTNIGVSFFGIKITKCRLIDFVNTILCPLSNGTVVVLLILWAKTTMSVGVFGFIMFVFMGTFAYLFLTFLSDKFFNYKIRALLKERINSFKSI